MNYTLPPAKLESKFTSAICYLERHILVVAVVVKFSPVSSAWQVDYLPAEPSGKPILLHEIANNLRVICGGLNNKACEQQLATDSKQWGNNIQNNLS